MPFFCDENKLPMSLLQEGTSTKASGKSSNLTGVEPFSQTFGPSSQRKRPRMDVALSSFEELAASSDQAGRDAEAKAKAEQDKAAGLGRSEPIYSKGQSRRIWAELYKVIDSSDVVIHVLDVRDPLGTRCRSVEKHLREEKPHKHLVFLLNKVDLVPTWLPRAGSKSCPRSTPRLRSMRPSTTLLARGRLSSCFANLACYTRTRSRSLSVLLAIQTRASRV
ncbi:hypothetical protein L7F22_047631 [Adiantum nelumboides]|nr:hypothetical protein [Adiantum nelumboides]